MFNRAFALALGLSLLAGSGLTAADYKKKAEKNIPETAVAAGSFETLVTAVKAAGLLETLSGKGPFTVFAPTDEAFAKLPEGTVAALLKDLPKLRAILKFHVVKGALPASKVVKKEHVKTLNGQKLAVSTSEGVKIGTASVVKADVMTSNGIIHVIDRVLLPEADIVDTARAAGSFSTLLAAAEAAGLLDALRGEGPLTVFAPTDEAFAALPEGTVESLLADKEKLTAILTYHVLPGEMVSGKLVKKNRVKSLQGGFIGVEVKALESGAKVMVNQASVVKADIQTANGVIHVIDQVILPSGGPRA